VIVTILAGIGIGVGAYRAGEDAGITQGIEQVQTAQETGQEVQVVHVVGDGPRGSFPGFFLFPLFLIGGPGPPCQSTEAVPYSGGPAGR